MSLDETQPPGARPSEDVWPIEPDPAVTNLAPRQLWLFSDGSPVAAEVGGIRIPAQDPRIAHLGIRRDAAGQPWPAAFVHAPDTGAPLGPCGPAPEPVILDIDADSAVEVPLPSGLPALLRAGRPAALYLFQENLGALEAWDGHAFSGLGRLPPADRPSEGEPCGRGLAADGGGFAYLTGDGLIAVPLPQLGPGLAHTIAQAPGLRVLSAPCRRGSDLLALGARESRLVLCRASTLPDAGPLALQDLGQEAPEAGFAGPWTNRLGDAFWTGEAGFVACPADAASAAFAPWPDGFAALPAQAPWRDRADHHHQLGLAGGRYHYAALGGSPVLRGLDGPHLAAGVVTYAGAERFDVPWQEPAEALNLGPHAGSLLVPLLAMPRDTLLLALPIEGPRGSFIRGGVLPAPVTGHVLHHAHGTGLRRLPVGLAVARLGDAGALLHDRMLYLWSRTERRCHALRLRA